MIRIGAILFAIFVIAWPAVAKESRGVTIEGKSPAEFVAGQYGKAWAVVIGINEYQQDIPRLRYAVTDAQAVATELEAHGFSVVKLLDRQATRERILEVLGDELPSQMKPEDRLMVFYAGHGETRTIAGGQTMGYLLPVDAKRDRLHKSAINMGEIRQLAALLPAKHVLFVVDVCYGGIAGQQYRGTLPPQTENYLRQITAEKGRQLITAGGPGQQVVEGPQWGHSVFTYYLLEGLSKGLADLNHDGVIPASELYAYLEGRIPAASENQQRPEKWDLAPEKGEFVFMTAARGTAGSSVASAPASRTEPAILSAGISKAEQELKALEVQERQVEEQTRQADLQQQIEAKKKQIEEKKKRLEVASLPSYSQPKEMEREASKDGGLTVLVTAGQFEMGRGSSNGVSDESPWRRIHLDDFYIDKHEVTTSRYAQFLQATSRKSPDDWSQQVALVGTGERPVVNVSWRDADAYCRHYGKRLPTEAEWEKAARGTDGRLYPWGNSEPSSRHALFNATWIGYGTLAVVGSHEGGTSPYGISDMAGNVWEWVADWYDESYYRNSPDRNPSGPPNGEKKVFRGGSWNNNAVDVRSTYRNSWYPTFKSNYLGFRCAQDAR